MSVHTPEQYAAIHKQAFRIAFDFLNEHFPPENSAEWWEQAANDVTQIGNMYGESRCVVHLVAAVYEYLEEVNKRRVQDVGKTHD